MSVLAQPSSQHLDSDKATPQMLSEIAHFMQKRALKASEGVFETILEQLPGVVSVELQAQDGSRETEALVASIVEQCSDMIEQRSRSDRTLDRSLRKLSDPETLKGSHQVFNDVVADELRKWRESLPKAVLKAVESKDFSESLAERLPPAPPLDVQRLLPRFREQLRAELRDRTQLQSVDLASVREALAGSLQEISAQTLAGLEELLAHARREAAPARLTQLCAAELRGALRPECREREPLREAFARRLRPLALQPQLELEASAAELAGAGAVLARCRLEREGANLAG